MRTRTHKPQHLHALALAAMAALGAAPVAAQQAEAQAEQITVTGSRIRGIAPIGASVVGVQRGDIEASGVASSAQMLQQVPQIFNLGVSENSRGQSGGAGNITYGSSVNIRGIGPFATLVLVNGHRVVGQGTAAATVDPNIIPMLLLDRVEIVPDGASAIYGSDAVAGVANLILRRNEKTVQAYARLGHADSYGEQQLGALWGTRWTGGQATLAYEYTHRDALSGRDRDYFTGDLRAQGGGDFRSTQCAPGNIVISGVNYAIPAAGVTAANAASLVAGTQNKCDNQKVQDLIPRQERGGIGFTLNHELGASGVSLYADGFATERKYRFRPGALASTLTVPATNAFYVRPPTAPAGTSETVAYSFINDLPVNTANGFSRSYEATVGADVSVGKDWKAGALYTFGYNDDLSVSLGGLNNAAIATALASNNPATALNVFGGSTNAAVLAGIANNVAYSPGTTHFQNLLVKADGPLFALPAGPLRAAIGYEAQRIKTWGGQTTGPITNPTSGTVTLKREVDSAYLELAAPLVSTGMAVPGVRRLDLTAAVRQDRYSDVGSTTNPKVGLNWQPVESLVLKGSYGKSFRAPGLTQIRGFTNGGRGGLFVQNYSDPTQNGALRVGVALSAANLDLKPETAKTKSLGLEFEPVKGTKLSLNWFDIVYDNQIIGYLSDLTVLNREASFAGTPVIQRNPSAALQAQLLATYPISGVPPANWTLFVDGRNFNLAKSISRGWDFSASTRLPTEHWGQFNLGLNGTVFTKYEVNVTPASAAVSQLNTIFNPMKFKLRASAGWTYGPTYSNFYINHVNGYDNNLANPVQRVRALTTLDARVAVALEDLGSAALLKDTTLAIGVQNAFDKKPPFVNLAQSNNGGGGFDPTQVNPVGRLFSVSLDKRF